MKITKNTVVSISYRLYSNDADNELIEETEQGDPFSFLYGHGEVLPGVESGLDGLSTGDQFTIALKCEEAFGPEREDLYHEFPKSEFMVDGELNEELLEEGEVIPMQDDQGNEVYGVVSENRLNSIIIDFNHPLAGEDIRYEGEVVAVREASDQELQDGTPAIVN